LSFVFALSTFLSTSKNGFLALVFILLIIATYAVVRYRKWLLGISVVLIIWIIASSLLKDINSGNSSFHGFDQVSKVLNEEEVSKKAGESTAVRVLIWKSAWEIIKKHPLIGVGTGDVKDELRANYKLNGYEEPFKKNYNAHNQYFQTFVALGGVGLLLFLLVFAYPAFMSYSKNNYLYLMFTINIAVSCLTESILEVQAGVIFFAFFTCLFSPILTATTNRKLNFLESKP
jgi:O-antigen ligase